MKNLTKKQIIIFIVIAIILLVIGFASGLYVRTVIYNNKLIKEKEKQRSISAMMSQSEINNLKQTIEKDEADYGDNYRNIKDNFTNYKKEPDKIYYKCSKLGTFYEFDKKDENFQHLLEAAEDRMHYAVIDDYNLNCFTPDSIDTMMTSGKNYIIFDYDNGEMTEMYDDYNRDIVFSFLDNTRLYRLVTYLSYYKEPILKDNLNKKEFAYNTHISGYKYMTSTYGD